MSPQLIIMAAGMGSRYGGLKQIDGFGPHDETILEYSIYDAIQAGFDNVILVIRESFHEDFERVLGSAFCNHINVQYVYQDISPSIPGFDLPKRTKPWGTGHAVLAAKEYIHSPFCVINADDRYGRDAFKQMYTYLESIAAPERCSLVGYSLANTLSPHGTVNRGICEVKDNVLISIEEHLKIARNEDNIPTDSKGNTFTDDTVVSMNFWGFHHSILDLFESSFHDFLREHGNTDASEFYITTPPHLFIQKENQQCDVMVSTTRRHGVTYAGDKIYVQDAIGGYISQGIYPNLLWS